MSILLIDLGNTRLKWALAPSHGDMSSDFTEQGFSTHDSPNQLSQFDQLSKNQIIEKIICSSVISEDKTLALKKHCQTIMSQAAWFQINGTSAIKHLGSQYDEEQQLGADRRSMALGAHEMFPGKHILVVGVGTATTIDLITPTQHMGGWIFPGMSLMTSALNANTAQLPNVSTEDQTSSLKIGTNTNDGIYQGILASHVGAIMMAQEYVKNQKMTLDLMIVTGGNAKKLIGYLKDSGSSLTIHHEEQLVLKGLLAWNKMGLS
ncbi:type III pantothenate kinase [Polynucleobacter sp. MWH-CaK5]|uniref:type III pantothenate kinase n=1 Tax=Polynucleobacter sp. MWH-CaK5 TaxID=2689107 RepID=UPI001BFD1BD4|nr:type III pantothenate kinase [Polynucleobacter sp. MWH-CaK5]QWD88825.1 type III pantothenate kinase [Polynucleobacter sp. MWH-CaK5]